MPSKSYTRSRSRAGFHGRICCCCGHTILCVLVCISWGGHGCLWCLFLFGLGPNAWLLCCRFKSATEHNKILLCPMGRLSFRSRFQTCSCLNSIQFLFIRAQKRVAGVYTVHMRGGQQAVGVVHLQGLKDSHVTLWLHPSVAYHKGVHVYLLPTVVQ